MDADRSYYSIPRVNFKNRQNFKDDKMYGKID